MTFVTIDWFNILLAELKSLCSSPAVKYFIFYSTIVHFQLIKVNNERFAVPEILFHPSNIGIEEMGLAETVAYILTLVPEGKCFFNCSVNNSIQITDFNNENENLLFGFRENLLSFFYNRIQKGVLKSSYPNILAKI